MRMSRIIIKNLSELKDIDISLEDVTVLTYLSDRWENELYNTIMALVAMAYTRGWSYPFFLDKKATENSYAELQFSDPECTMKITFKNGTHSIKCSLEDDKKIREWLSDNVIESEAQCMRHMGGLSNGILSAALGVNKSEDINEHIGRTIPWLSMFAKDGSNCLFVTKDIFQGLHPKLIIRWGELMRNFSNSRQALICTMRTYEFFKGFQGKNCVCYAIHDGISERIERSSHKTYTNTISDRMSEIYSHSHS